MKHIFTLIGVITFTAIASAQDNVKLPPEVSPSTVVGDTNIPSGDVKQRLIDFAQGANDSKTFVVALYPSFAPELVTDGRKNQWGFGAAALYQVNQFLYTGLRVDYLGGEFWAPSVNVGLKADVQLFGLNFTPLVYSGGVVPLSGAGDKDGDWGYIIGGGIKAVLWEGKVFGKDATFDLAATAEKWSQFDGNVFHIAPVFKVSW